LTSSFFRYYFTADLSALPAVNFGTFVAGIFISAPVCGLRPFLAFLLLMEKVPKPTRVTLSPFFRALMMCLTQVSIAFPAAAFDILALIACYRINEICFCHDNSPFPLV
jgi:putative acetyltransferase